MPRSNSRLLAGLILFVVGAAGFAYGLVTYNAAHESVAGKLNSVGNSIAKALNGTRGSIFPNMTTAEQTAAIFMVAGGVIAVIGLLALLVRGRRR
jgi:hypothetical protein